MPVPTNDSMLRRLFPKPLVEGIIDLLYPPVCHVCDAHLAPHERFVCASCLSKLPRTGYHRNPDNPMVERFAGQFPFSQASGHFFYTRDSQFASLIHDMKYRNFPLIGNFLGSVVGKELFSTGFFDGVEMIVPLPMHFWKRARRGYNQTDHIAAGLSEATGIPVANALTAIRAHRTQTALSREERMANTSHLFQVTDPVTVAGKGVLLLDDICTTGATLRSAAEAIHEAKPSSLTLLTLGITL